MVCQPGLRPRRRCTWFITFVIEHGRNRCAQTRHSAWKGSDGAYRRRLRLRRLRALCQLRGDGSALRVAIRLDRGAVSQDKSRCGGAVEDGVQIIE